MYINTYLLCGIQTLHQSILLTKHATESPLPVLFCLPTNYSPVVMAGLQAKSLSGKAPTKFISEIAAAVFMHKSYPTREEKVCMAIQCIKKFLFLESSCGRGFVS